jgi:hypothetical protein
VSRPIEPVHWQARLRRSPTVRYTEVGGLPVLCDVEDRSVRVLNAPTVALWARLDGRPLADAVGVADGAWTDEELRSVIEVVRRLKASGVVEDVPGVAHEGPRLDTPLDEEVLSVSSIRVRAVWVSNGSGDVASGVLSLERRGDVEEVVVIPGARGPDGEMRPTRVADRVVSAVVAPRIPEVSDDVSVEVVAFAAWARAVVDAAELSRAGVVDALAGLAESVPLVPEPG